MNLTNSYFFKLSNQLCISKLSLVQKMACRLVSTKKAVKLNHSLTSQHQAIVWTNAEIYIVRPFRSNFGYIVIPIQTFH